MPVDENGKEIEAAEGADAIAEAVKEATVALQARLDVSEASNTKLNELLADPDVATMLEAKDAGKSLRLVVGGAEAGGEGVVPPVMPDDLDLDGMSGSEQVRVIMEQVKAAITAAQTEGSSKLTERLDTIEGRNAAESKAKVKGEVAELVKEYPDLPKFKQEIVALTEGGLSIKEAYAVARLRSGQGLPEAPAVEKPTQVTVRNAPKEQPARQGARGFSLDVKDVLDRIDIPGDSEE